MSFKVVRSVTLVMALCIAALVAVLMTGVPGAASAAQAQGRGGGAPPAAQAPPTPQSTAGIDLTGNWVAVVTEDWRWRMVTPPKGDYSSLPINAEGTKVADTWMPAMDGQCEAFGMAGLMRQPTRLRISWQDPQTLKIETDNGVQTRLLHFDDNAAVPTARSLQGFTKAEWERPGRNARGGVGGGGGGLGGGAGGLNAGAAAGAGGRAAAPPRPGGSLKAVTTMLRAAWLRKNGVPYSENAEVTEYFERFSVANNDEWLTVSTIVHDPKYFTEDVVVSSHFKKEADASKWDPKPCRNAS